MKISWLTLTVLVVLLLINTGFIYAAADGKNIEASKLIQLKNDLVKHTDYTLVFEQNNRNLTTGDLVSGEGTLRICSLEKFEWVYTSQPQNRIVSDGTILIMLTPDTEQAMIGKSDEFQEIWSPVSLLNKPDIESSFQISRISQIDAYPLEIRLQPIGNDMSFEYLDLIFYSKETSIPFDFVLFDKAGSSNIIKFKKMTVLENDAPICLPDIPKSYDVTDFQGNPVNLTSVLKEAKNE